MLWVDDLRKVKNIDYIRLDNFIRYLTVQDDENDISEPEQEHDSCNGTNGYSRMNGGPFKYSSTNGIMNGMPASASADIFELLSIYSTRPIVNEIFKYSRNEKPAIRIASWNLDDFSIEKVSNFGVKEVVCRTLLENGWSIVAVQNVECDVCLKMICDELNKPKLHRVQEWKNNSRHWKFETYTLLGTKLGFIYDARGANNIKLISAEKGPPELDFFCESILANFEIENTKVQILNVIVKYQHQSNLQEVQYHFQKLMNFDTNYSICGDFGELMNKIEILTDLENSKLVLPVNLLKHHSNSTTNFAKQCTSNFLLNTKFQKYLTGMHGIVRQGLTHLAIPLGWRWGGPASSYSPIWVEFFVNSELNM
ncbi:hypothetical protein HHI36_005325 [Cryptolaemus montrouzieri]|uniref:Endonuclease/exonuclease/phosphatase domain-containing protein n=1 Tax=Cryptolaemus montrouzieri TaxID=559131 RepID=A0ABD2NUA8_9CUCU